MQPSTFEIIAIVLMVVLFGLGVFFALAFLFPQLGQRVLKRRLRDQVLTPAQQRAAKLSLLLSSATLVSFGIQLLARVLTPLVCDSQTTLQGLRIFSSEITAF